MSKSSVQIATPCLEQWADMKLSEGGRFCGNCQKAVVDFTAMTDEEMIQAMSQQKGSACGRFRAEQLNRPLRTYSYSTAPHAQRRLFGLLTASLLGWHTTQAQVGAHDIGGDTSSVQTAESQAKDQSSSNTLSAATPIDSSRIITGRVISEQDGANLSGVAISIKGTSAGVNSDATGNFRLVIPAEYTPELVVLSVSSVGYVSHEVSVKLNKHSPLSIALHEDAMALNEVIVVGNYEKPSFLDRMRNRLPIRH